MDSSDSITRLVLRWQELREQGQTPSVEELCAASPELQPAVERRISALESLYRRIEASTLAHETVPQPAEEDETPAAGFPRIAGYEILQLLGRGGMGVVYKARQVHLNRLVALKMIRAGKRRRTAELARFYIEAEAVARVQHPNIIQIHEVGLAADGPYFSMEYADGGSLAKVINHRPHPAAVAAPLVETLARAMHAAHQRGIIHRDLKPANILLQAGTTETQRHREEGKKSKDSANTPVVAYAPHSSEPLPLSSLCLGGSVVQSVPKITDFGLAKRLDVDLGHTVSGMILGTPSYMAPEQARGRVKEIGPAADIYALGAILYELLTGRPPFRGDTAADTIVQVISTLPTPPSDWQPKVPRELEAVCLKCLEKEPANRYGTAELLADDLGRWLRREPTLARPKGWAARTWSRLRGQSLAVAAAVLVGLVILAGALAFRPADVAPPPFDSQGELKRLQDDLKEGKTVTLVGDNNRPSWLDWPIHEAGLQRPKPGNQGVSYHAAQLSLLELLPDPRCERYRFEALVRHDLGSSPGFTGIYGGHQRVATPSGTVSCFLAIMFNDLLDGTAVFPQAEPENKVRLHWRIMRPADAARNVTIINSQVFVPEPGMFRPHLQRHGNGAWRALAFEVAPTGLTAFWEGKPFTKVRRKELEELLWLLQSKNAELQALPLEFRPRGGLGLYLDDGAAAFRQVRVVPLPEPVEIPLP